MNANPVNWFEIPVHDLDRARHFYEAVFGLKLTIEEMGPMEMAFFPMAADSYGAAGALMKAEGYVPSYEGTTVYFRVGDIDGMLAKIAVSGGKTLLPKTAIGQYGYIAHFQDSEGNRVALHSMNQ
ncbi:MAG: VOC family protein [Negativicutes bacterium]|nr:VOC family protein [Negativicutes bacterium]